MKKRGLILAFCFLALAANAQIAKIVIAAGTPEDQALQAITNESDSQKRLAMLQEFVGKFAGNREAVAYGHWQIAQQYLNQGELPKAIGAADKALEAQPNNLDILVFAAGLAQQAKDSARVVDYACKGGSAFNGAATQPKPDNVSAEDFTARVKQDQESVKPSYDYLEVAAVNAIRDEKDDNARMGYIERYITAFPASSYQDQIAQLAIYTLGNLKDPARLAGFGEKSLVGNPNNLPVLVLLASAFAESPDPSYAKQAETYARRALEASKTQSGLEAQKLKMLTGLAHSSLGFALLKQDKFLPAITELKAASGDVKEDANAYGAVLYRLGFAYAKAGKLVDAKNVLTEATTVNSSSQAQARELLAKVEAAGTKTRR